MTKKKAAAPAKPPAASKPPAKPSPAAMAAEAARAAQEAQQRKWEDAMKLFGQQKFAEARARFAEVMKGPRVDVADKARTYSAMCERRLGPPKPQLKSAEEHFTFGVERLNARDLSEARIHLEKALSLAPKGDHILYALALCRGFEGDGSAAAEHLRRAIEISPGNRIHARQDAEFQALASQFPAVKSLLGTEARAAE